MSPSFVTRLCSDWTVHPFSIWLTSLSRWRDPFIPTVQQSAPCCNLSLHPKHRCKDTGYFSRVHARTVFMRAQAQKMHSEHTQLQCAHIFISRQTPTDADAPFYCDIWVHMQIVLLWQFKKENSWLKMEAMGRRHMQRMLIEVANYTKGSTVFLLHYILICHRMRSAGAV